MEPAILLQKIEDLVAPVLSEMGLWLVEREFIQEYGRLVLRVYIDREPSGNPIQITDCEAASRRIEALLDVENCIPGAYVLEVSSPGDDRPLRRKEDFTKFAGKKVQVKTKEVCQGFKSFTGMLEGMEGDQIIVRGERENYRIPFHMLAKARIKP